MPLFLMSVLLIFPMQQATSSSLDDQEISLARLSQDESIDLATRVEATRLLGQFSGPNALIAIGRASRSADVELRLAAIQAAAQWNGQARWDIVSPLLDDPDKPVRAASVMALVPHWSQMSSVYRDKLEPYVEQYLSSLSDGVEGQLIAAWAEQSMGLFDDAEKRLHRLYEEQPSGRVVLGYSKVLLANNKAQQAQRLLESNAERFSNSAALYHQLGVVSMMTGDDSSSMRAYEMAYQLDPTIEHYAFDYALSIQVSEPQASINIYNKLYGQSNSPQYLYAKCEVMLMHGIEAEECLSDLSRETSRDVADGLRENAQPLSTED